jgi:heme iron utilization protein
MPYEHALHHLNADHADALLDIARAFGSVPEGTAARVVAIDDAGMDVEVEAGDAPARHTRVPIQPPMTEATARERLVELTERAREALGKVQ